MQYPLKVFSAANMAGYMGVDAMRNDIASDLGWFKHRPRVLSVIKALHKKKLKPKKEFLYNNGITYNKATSDGTGIKVSFFFMSLGIYGF